ncbi:MAG: hypothetical protein RL514_2932 [Verrucomicrobiota bacterium]|jgi:hypothetical protein
MSVLADTNLFVKFGHCQPLPAEVERALDTANRALPVRDLCVGGVPALAGGPVENQSRHMAGRCYR